MGVMLLGHTGIRVAKLLGNDSHRNSTHGQMRGVRMSQHMEGYGGCYSGFATGVLEGAVLLGRSPYPTIGSLKEMFVELFVSSPVQEQREPFVGQGDVANFALTQADGEGPAIGIERRDFQFAQL